MIEAAVEQVHAGKRFLVACHRRPDADSLGSALGLIATLRALGKEVSLYVPEELAPSLHFLMKDERPLREVSPDARFDATWIMDIAAKKLLPPGLPPPEVTGPIVVIDHHYAHDDVGDVVIRDVDAAATGEVVVRLIRALGLKEIPRGAATPLYAAIVSDTGGFRYRSTRPETLRLGAQLVEAGADPWQVAYELFERWPTARLSLLSAVFGTLEIGFGGRVAIMRVTREMLDACGGDDEMVEGIVNFARSIDGVQVGALLWEWPVSDERGKRIETKISLRSSGEVNVSDVAVALGGGGHRAAAATQLDVTIEEATRRLNVELGKLFG